MAAEDGLLDLARLLCARLERLSADSTWARRASGLRGSLFKAVDALQDRSADPTAARAHLERLVYLGFEMLENAAREIS